MDRGRRQERTRLIYHLRLFDRSSGEQLGHLIDLTPDGMMLLGESPLEAGRIIDIRMALPRNVMSGRSIEFRGTVKWCNRDAEAGFYATGLEVVDLSDRARRTVSELISAFYENPADEALDDDLERYL